MPPGLTAEETSPRHPRAGRPGRACPHPFDRFRGSLGSEARLERELDGLVDCGLRETHNARLIGSGNPPRPRSRASHGLPGRRGLGRPQRVIEVGVAYTVARRRSARTPAGAHRRPRSPASTLVPRRRATLRGSRLDAGRQARPARSAATAASTVRSTARRRADRPAATGHQSLSDADGPPGPERHRPTRRSRRTTGSTAGRHETSSRARPAVAAPARAAHDHLDRPAPGGARCCFARGPPRVPARPAARRSSPRPTRGGCWPRSASTTSASRSAATAGRLLLRGTGYPLKVEGLDRDHLHQLAGQLRRAGQAGRRLSRVPAAHQHARLAQPDLRHRVHRARLRPLRDRAASGSLAGFWSFRDGMPPTGPARSS